MRRGFEIFKSSVIKDESEKVENEDKVTKVSDMRIKVDIKDYGKRGYHTSARGGQLQVFNSKINKPVCNGEFCDVFGEELDKGCYNDSIEDKKNKI